MVEAGEVNVYVRVCVCVCAHALCLCVTARCGWMSHVIRKGSCIISFIFITGMWSATARWGPTATHTLHNEMWPVCVCVWILWTEGKRTVCLCSIIVWVCVLQLYAPMSAYMCVCVSSYLWACKCVCVWVCVRACMCAEWSAQATLPWKVVR